MKLWNPQTSELTTLESHSSAITCACFSGDNTLAVLGTKDGTIQLWSMLTGAFLTPLTGHTHDITSVAFSRDQSRTASGSGDKTVRLWDMISYSLLWTFEGHTNVITSVYFSTDSSYIMSWAGENAKVHWDTKSGNVVRGLRSDLRWDPGAPQSYCLVNPWLKHSISSMSHAVWVPWELRGQVWPSHSS